MKSNSVETNQRIRTILEKPAPPNENIPTTSLDTPERDRERKEKIQEILTDGFARLSASAARIQQVLTDGLTVPSASSANTDTVSVTETDAKETDPNRKEKIQQILTDGVALSSASAAVIASATATASAAICLYCKEIHRYRASFSSQYAQFGQISTVPGLCKQVESSQKCTQCNLSRYHHLIYSDRNCTTTRDGVIIGYAIEYVGNDENFGETELYCPVAKCRCCKAPFNYFLGNDEFIMRIPITDGMHYIFAEDEIVRMMLESAPCCFCPHCTRPHNPAHWISHPELPRYAALASCTSQSKTE